MNRRTLASLTLCVAFAAAPAWAASDASFVRKALQGDNSEMRLGEIAADRGASIEVRQFGRMLRQDHRQAKQDALQVARRLGVRPTSAMTPEARQEARKLMRLSGAAFDHEFARYMVDDHRKDVDDFEKQARRGGSATRRMAERTLPTLRHHLEVARSLARGT
jgi:putative membrane protein